MMPSPTDQIHPDPFPSMPLASWRRPTWAARSEANAGGISYFLEDLPVGIELDVNVLDDPATGETSWVQRPLIFFASDDEFPDLRRINFSLRDARAIAAGMSCEAMDNSPVSAYLQEAFRAALALVEPTPANAGPKSWTSVDQWTPPAWATSVVHVEDEGYVAYCLTLNDGDSYMVSRLRHRFDPDELTATLGEPLLSYQAAVGDVCEERTIGEARSFVSGGTLPRQTDEWPIEEMRTSFRELLEAFDACPRMTTQHVDEREGVTSEQLREMEQRELAAATQLPAPPCPAWCINTECLWEWDGEVLHRVHRSASAFGGVAAEYWEYADDRPQSATVDVYRAGDTDLTPAEARSLAAELFRLADLADPIEGGER